MTGWFSRPLQKALSPCRKETPLEVATLTTQVVTAVARGVTLIVQVFLELACPLEHLVSVHPTPRRTGCRLC